MKNSDASLLSSGAWSLLNQIVRVGAIAAVTIALSRHFGPRGFGSLAVGLAFVRVFAVVATFGLDRVVIRHLVDQAHASGSVVRDVFRLKLGIALLSYVAMLALVFTLRRGDTFLFAIASLAGGSLLFQSFDIYDYAFQAENRFGLTFLGRGVPLLLSAVIKISALLLGAPLLVFAALETVEGAAVGSALFLIYRRTHPQSALPTAPPPIIRRRLILEGLPLLLGALGIMIYMRSDIVLLGKLAGYGTAGIYAAASQISEGCALLPLAFMPALFPALVRWRKLGLQFYQRRFEKLFLVAVTSGLIFSVALTFGARLIVNLLFGAAYLSAANILVVHGWTLVFVFLGITQSGYEVTEGLTWFGTAKTFAGAVLNIGLNLWLIPIYGAVGSAVATLVAQICSSTLFNALHPRTRPILAMQINSLLLWPAFRDVLRGGFRDRTSWQDLPERVTLADG